MKIPLVVWAVLIFCKGCVRQYALVAVQQGSCPSKLTSDLCLIETLAKGLLKNTDPWAGQCSFSVSDPGILAPWQDEGVFS